MDDESLVKLKSIIVKLFIVVYIRLVAKKAT